MKGIKPNEEIYADYGADYWPRSYYKKKKFFFFQKKWVIKKTKRRKK